MKDVSAIFRGSKLKVVENELDVILIAFLDVILN